MSHVALLGDSIFDNGAYTGGGPDVVSQLRDILPGEWRATLAAVDGDVAAGLPAQLRRLPRDVTHIAVSAGGNDALAHIGLLTTPARSAAQVLTWLAEAAGGFEERYRRALEAVIGRGLPTTVCTIYNGSFPDPAYQRLASTALATFNDAILRFAFERRLDVVDLRIICDEPGDYANPIEPSSRGGAKIARALAESVGALERRPSARVIAR